MRRIYYIRHGQTEDNVRGVLTGQSNAQLTDAGRRQARAAPSHEPPRPRHRVARPWAVAFEAPAFRAANIGQYSARWTRLVSARAHFYVPRRESRRRAGHTQRPIRRTAGALVSERAV